MFKSFLSFVLIFQISIFSYVSCCRTGLFFPENGVKGIAVMKGKFGNSSIAGTVRFDQPSQDDLVTVTVNLTGIPKELGSKHGLHVHQSGIVDPSDNTAIMCGSAGPHFNPLNVTHGDISGVVRHVGDFGNVVSNENGTILVTFTDNLSQLFGPFGILGRTIVLHASEDDLGLKNDTGSKTFGNSGPRLACGVIGILP